MPLRYNRGLAAMGAAIVCLGACQSEAAQANFQVGRGRTGVLIYEGALRPAGAVEIKQELKAGEAVAISSHGGDIGAGITIAELINSKGGYARVSGSCYSECASSMAFTLQRFVVPRGSTILFTRNSLTALEDGAADKILACLPESVSNSQYIWVSPEVFADIGMTNVQFEWTLSSSARESYENAVAGSDVYWMDACRHS